ncbi:MAG: STAS domain-containing protein [bacterium]
MQLETRTLGEYRVFVPKGKLSAVELKEFVDKMAEEINKGCVKIALNLEHTVLIDSRTLGMLIHTNIKLQSNKGELVLFNLTPDLKMAAREMSLDMVFSIFGSEDAFKKAMDIS